MIHINADWFMRDITHKLFFRRCIAVCGANNAIATICPVSLEILLLKLTSSAIKC